MTIKASSPAYAGTGAKVPESLPTSLETGVSGFTSSVSVSAASNPPNSGYSTDPTPAAANSNDNAANQTMVLNALAQQLAAAQQAQGAQANGAQANGAQANGAQANGALIAAQLLQQLSTPEGRANFQQMQVKILPDGRIIPNPRMGVAHIYLKDIVSRSPANLPDLDGRLWNEFYLRLSPISRQIKKTLYSFVAYGILSIVLCAIIPFVLHPLAIGGATVFTFACFFCIVFVSKKKWKAVNEEVKEICVEYGPKFELKGHLLEYYDSMGLIVVTRKEDAV